MPSPGEQRTAIRAQILIQIEAVYDGPVVTDRQVDARKLGEYVHIRLLSGEMTYDGLEGVTHSILVVVINKTGTVKDSDLDSLGDTIENGLFSDASFAGNVIGITADGYEYEDDEKDQYSALVLSYTITH